MYAMNRGKLHQSPVLGRIRKLRKIKTQRVVSTLLAKQSKIPRFIQSLKNISKQKRILSILFFTLLIINLAVCIYQTTDRLLYYMTEPTTVDSHLIETTYGSFPYVYIFPLSTREYQHLSHKLGLFQLPSPDGPPILDILKYMSTPSYITDAYFAMGKQRINLTIQNYDAILQPTAQVSSPFLLPYGSRNYKMIIKLKFPPNCRWFYGLIDPSPIQYYAFFNDEKFMDMYGKTGLINFLATANFKKYHFISTKRGPCDNNLHDCLRLCLLKNITCRYPFYEARNLPKCNNSYQREEYKKWKTFLRATNIIEHCKCLDLCDVTHQSLTFDKIFGSETIIAVSVVSNDVRTMHERLSYDVISLFCDIGGNIGLYFGMSCLTLVEIFVYYCRKIPLLNLKKPRKKNSKIKDKIKNTLEKIQKAPKQSFTANKLKSSLLVSLIIIAVYNVYNSINSYFDYPLIKTVILVRDDIIQLPLIVDCQDNANIYYAKLQLAKQLHADCATLQLYDLLHPLSKFANKSEELWKYSSNFNGKYKDGNQWQTYNKKHRVFGNANISDLSTIFGICTVFRLADMEYSLSKTFLHISDSSIKFRRNYACIGIQPNYILPQDQFVHPKHIFYIRHAKRLNVDLLRQTLLRQNTPKSPCQANDQVSQCELKCYSDKLKLQSFKCKLPFMTKSELPLCMTQETAKMTQKMYLEIQFKTDPQKNCSCVNRCEETIFLRMLTDQNIFGEKEIKYYMTENIREVIEERSSISIIKLLCQIGSIIAILTGLSIFALFQYFI